MPKRSASAFKSAQALLVFLIVIFLTDHLSAEKVSSKGAMFFSHSNKVWSEKELKNSISRSNESIRYKAPNGEIEFTVTFEDEEGVGFRDSERGEQRSATVFAVLDYLDKVIKAPGGHLDLVLGKSELDGKDGLAATGTVFPLEDGFYDSAAFVNLTKGNDHFEGMPDVLTVVDFGYAWHDSPEPLEIGLYSRYDLFSVLLHEFTHGLGVTSLAQANGQSAFEVGENPVKTFSRWNQLMSAENGQATLWLGSPPSFEYKDESIFEGGGSSVVFHGRHAGGTLGVFPPLYTNSSFAPGKSLSHWQDRDPIPENPVMEHSRGRNESVRVYLDFELQALGDLGYTLEPRTGTFWIMR